MNISNLMQALLTQVHDPLLLMVQRPGLSQTPLSRLNHDFAINVALEDQPAINVVFVQKGLLDDAHSFINDIQTPLCVVYVHVIHILYIDSQAIVTLEDNTSVSTPTYPCHHSAFQLHKQHTLEFNVQPDRQPSPTSTLHVFSLLPLHSKKASFFNTTEYTIQLSLVLPVRLEKFNVAEPKEDLPLLDPNFDIRSFLA